MNSQIVASLLSYSGYGNTQNSLESDNSLDSDGPGRLLPSPITSGTFYVGIVINATSAPASGARNVIRVMNGSAFSTTCRLFIQAAGGSGFQVGIKIGDPSTAAGLTTGTYPYNQDHLVIIKYKINPGSANDIMDLFVNPAYAMGEPAVPTVTAPISNLEASTSIDRFAFPWNVNNTQRFNGNVGMVNFARTWNELTLSNASLSREKAALKYYSNTRSLDFGTEVTGELQIFNLEGKLIYQSWVENKALVNLDQLTSGAYILSFTNQNGTASQLKFAVQ
ncbi:MAG: T9SS type A sorting domain-containing protein [Nonlabens sp.]